MMIWYVLLLLYIFIFLHQTTTPRTLERGGVGCISLYSYIKPQLIELKLCRRDSCISLYSYIKPQRSPTPPLYAFVVYLYIPTSNHNSAAFGERLLLLYIFIFLHQTTTAVNAEKFAGSLYIFIFLHQTTTTKAIISKLWLLYIFIFLHQTTTIFKKLSVTRWLYIFIFLHQTTT